jgi:aspartyl-tRNA(Asn)/glutamyl-tRNA(Gln) amidotransferase subunit C
MVALSWKEPLVAISPETVSHLAELAHIGLSSEELERLAPQVAEILSIVDEVAHVDTGGVPPTSHVVPFVNVFREDEVRDSLPVGVALAGAPSVDSDRFAVPRILGEAQ